MPGIGHKKKLWPFCLGYDSSRRDRKAQKAISFWWNSRLLLRILYCKCEGCKNKDHRWCGDELECISLICWVMLFQLLANNSGFRVTSSHLLILRHISRNDPIYLVAFRQFAILFFLRLVRRETPVKRTDLNSSDLENVLRFCTKRTRLDSTYTWSCTNEQLDPCAIQKRIRQMFTLPGRFRIVHQQKKVLGCCATIGSDKSKGTSYIIHCTIWGPSAKWCQVMDPVQQKTQAQVCHNSPQHRMWKEKETISKACEFQWRNLLLPSLT